MDERIDVIRVARIRQQVRSGEARRIREAAGISGALVAAGLGVSESTLARWEKGDRSPRPAVALRYGALLDELKGLPTGPKELSA